MESRLACLSDTSSTFNLRKALNTNAQGEFRFHQWRGMLWQFTMVNGDPFFTLMREYFTIMAGPQFSLLSIYDDNLELVKTSLEELEAASSEHFGQYHIKRANPIPKDVTSLMHLVTVQPVNPGICYGYTADWREKPLLDQVRLFLPGFPALKRIIDLYFERRLPGSEFCVPNILYSCLDHIYDEKITINSTSDVAIVACALLITRITVLSIQNPYKGSPSIAVEDKEFLLSVDGSLDVVELVESLVGKLNTKVDINFPSFQILILLFVYRLVCPEGDFFKEIGDIGAYFSEIVCMARSLGFNETEISPNYIEEIKESENITEQYKHRTWALLLTFDSLLACLFGAPLAIRLDECDLDRLSQNLAQYGDEPTSRLAYRMMPLARIMHSVCEKSFPINTLCPVSEIIQLLDSLEALTNDEFGSSPQKILESSIKSSLELSLLILIQCFLLCLYYTLYIYYENKGRYDTSSGYARKMFKTAFSTFGFVQKGFLVDCDEIFNQGSWMTFSPAVLICIKTQLLAVLIRLRFALPLNDGDYDDSQVVAYLKEILSRIEHYEKGIIRLTGFVGQHLNSAWWNYKSFKYGEHVVKGLETFKDCAYLRSKTKVRYSNEEIRLWKQTVEEMDCQAVTYQALFESRGTSPQVPAMSVLSTFHYDNYWYGVNCLRKYYKDKSFQSAFGETDSKQLLFYDDADIFWQFPFI